MTSSVQVGADDATLSFHGLGWLIAGAWAGGRTDRQSLMPVVFQVVHEVLDLVVLDRA